MKKRNLLFASFILSLGIGLFGCNFGGGGNITSYTSPAVVSFDMNILNTAIGTWYGICAAPGLDPSYMDQCVLLSFTVDWDNQPSADYITASAIQILSTIPQQPFIEDDSVRISGYTLPISSVGWDDTSTSPYYGGKFFIGINCKDNNATFRLVYNTQEPDSAGIKNLYLLAQPSTSSSTTDVSKNFAFDVMSLIYNAGSDTTDTSSGLKYRYVKANLKYLTGISGDGVPTYGSANTSSTGPFVFAVLE